MTLRRTELKRGKPLARGKRLKPKSAKRIADDETRRDVRMEVLTRDGNRCRAETIWPEVRCGGRVDVHEPNARSNNQGDWLDAEKCLAICRAHHDAIHANGRLARARGLLV